MVFTFVSQCILGVFKGAKRLQRLFEGSWENRRDYWQGWLASHRRYRRMASGKVKLIWLSPPQTMKMRMKMIIMLIINFIIWQSKSERSDWLFLGRDFAIRTVSVETVISCVFFVSIAGKFKTSMTRMPYNKLLTNLASSSRCARSVLPRPRANIPQYGPRARLVRG